MAPRANNIPSRWEEIETHGGTPQLPKVGPLAYLVPLSKRLGRVKGAGLGGVEAIPWSEVLAFRVQNGLTQQEADCLRLFSEKFVSGLKLGGDEFALPPWDGSDG